MQDLPQVIDGCASKLPTNVEYRVEFIPHDFLTKQPVKDDDVYLFHWIFHSWSDQYCIQILRKLIPALEKGAMVVINDKYLPKPGMMGLWQEERLRCVASSISLILHSSTLSLL